MLTKKRLFVYVTDLNGRFHLPVATNAVLRFSFIGYLPKDVEVNARTVVDVTLQASKKDLDNVVAVGYHEVRDNYKLS